MSLKFDATDLVKGLADYESKAQIAIRMYADTSALKLQNYARKNARWTDRTGQARQRLRGDSLVTTNGYRLRLAHGVNYGVYLELAHEKRFAIIQETINKVGSEEIMPGFENLLKKLD